MISRVGDNPNDELPEISCFRDDFIDIYEDFEPDDVLGGVPNFLFLAASSGDLHWAKLGMERNQNLEEKNGFGMTALHMAVIRGSWDIVAYLVKNGSDVHNEINDLPGSSIIDWCRVNRRLMYVVIVGTITDCAPYFSDETIR